MPNPLRDARFVGAGRPAAAALCCAALLGCGGGKPLAEASHWKFRTQEVDAELGIGYAVIAADVDGDGKKDLVVADLDRVVWYQNPTWKKRVVAKDATARDNICIGAYDVDQDGKLDFALGAGWQPGESKKDGTLQWLKQGATLDDPWTVHFIDARPSIHRLRWSDLDGDGRAELIVLPLFGAGAKPPQFDDVPVQFLAYKIPADPKTDRWPPIVLDDQMHVAHDFSAADVDGAGRTDFLVASYDGVSLLQQDPRDAGRWSRRLISSGDQAGPGNRGAGEAQYGRASGKACYIGAVEPLHGSRVVAYTRPAQPEQPWVRKVLDEQLTEGHGAASGDLDGDGAEELVVGVRGQAGAAAPCGVRIYKPSADAKEWSFFRLDPGGVAVEDLLCEDLDSDGAIDVVAVGRQTKNLRIYWNETPSQKNPAAVAP